MSRPAWETLCLAAIADDATRTFAAAYLAKTADILAEIEIKDRGEGGELIDATMFRAELASQVVSVALLHRLAAKGKGLRTLRAVANKSGRLTEGERRARQMERLAKWLEAVEKHTSFSQDVFLGLRNAGQLPVPPEGRFVVRERFVSEVLRAAAVAVRDVPPTVKAFGVEERIGGKGRTLPDSNLDAVVFDLQNVIQRFIKDPRVCNRPRHLDHLAELAEAALGVELRLTDEAMRARLARRKAKGTSPGALYLA